MTKGERAAFKHALRASARGCNVLSYHDGQRVIIVLNAAVTRSRDGSERVRGKQLTRTVSSAALARAVIARFGSDLNNAAFSHLSPAHVLDASVMYATAAWRLANLRRGKRV